MANSYYVKTEYVKKTVYFQSFNPLHVMKKSVHTLMIGALTLLPLCVSAQIGIGADSVLEATGTNAKASVGASAMPGSSKAETQSSAKADSSASNASNVTSATNTTATGSGSLGASNTSNHTESEVFRVTRSDVSDSGVVMSDPMNVTSSEDFAAYARSVLRIDENVSKIETSNDSVSVWYKEPAKFFGIVPIMVSTKATVMVDGTVVIEHPWWFKTFVTGGADAQMETDINSTAGSIARSEATTTLSSNTKARLVNALYSVMKTHYASSTDAAASTDASAEY